jgi:hypothetical protein
MHQPTLKNKSISNFNILALIFSVLLIILIQPYFIWKYEIFSKLAVLLVMPIALFYARTISRSDLIVLPFFIFFLFYFSYSNSLNVFGYLSNFSFIFLLLIRKDIALLFLKYFKNLFCITLLLSLISYVLIVFFNLNISYVSIPPLNPIKLYDYSQYPFLVSNRPLGISNLNIRFSGMFDEPGVIGSLAVIFLVADRFNLKTKQNIILLISGLLSFSLYFYVSILAYLIYLVSMKYRILIIFLCFLFYSITIKIEALNTLVWNRITIEDGSITGDNRSNDALDIIYQNFINSDDFLWGRGIEYALYHADGASSYKIFLLAYGLIFCIVAFLAFTLYAYFNINKFKHVLVFLFLFVSMFYQRPGFIIEPANFFFFIAAIYSINLYKDRGRDKNSILDSIETKKFQKNILT